MRIWTVHARPELQDGGTSDRSVRLVREGFSWGAFLPPLIWLGWNGLWLAALLYVLASVALGLVLPPGWTLPVLAALQFLLAVHARDLLRRSLARRGFIEAGVVAEQDLERALARLVAQRPDLTGPLVRSALA